MASALLGDVADEPLHLILPPKRQITTITNLSTKYREKDVDYNVQYCKLYNARLEQMLPYINERVNSKWGTKYPIIKVHKLQESRTKCIIIGTLFKDQKLKPSMLKKISEANSLVPQPVYTHFTDDSDQMFIEDELQRCQLIGNINVQKLVTGLTCAFLGINQGQGKFSVEEYCFADCRPQIERSLKTFDNKFICFLSGLDLVNFANNVQYLKMFNDWIDGFFCQEGPENNSDSILRLVIAGNSVRTEPEIRKQITFVAKVVESNETFTAVQKMDMIIHQLVKFFTVDVMPGPYDPSNHLLSQQPMHRCLFPSAAPYENLNLVTNPYEFEFNGVRILGTSGQPIKDIAAYSEIDNPLEALEQCLVWNHLAPTCPDTLGCYPYYEKDPFVIEQCPHVFFTGNQSKFETKLHEGPEGQKVRLICIPEFTKTHSVVLLNLSSLECHELSFEIDDL